MKNILGLLVSPFFLFYTILNPFQPSSEIKLNSRSDLDLDLHSIYFSRANTAFKHRQSTLP